MKDEKINYDLYSSVFFDFQKRMQYNKYFYFLVGGRGIGKTYGAKKYLIGRAINHKEKFVWVRRHEEEMDLMYQSFFDDVQQDEAFEQVKLKVVKNKIIYLYADDELIGFIIAISQSAKLKSVPFVNTRYIVYDEYLAEEGTNYLKNEPMRFTSLTSTVFRKHKYNNNKVIMLANNVSFFDPHKIYNNIPANKKLFKNKTYHYEMIDSREVKRYMEELLETRQGQHLRNTDYGKIAIDNEPIVVAEFVRKVPQHGVWQYNIGLKGKLYGVYGTQNNEGLLYISEKTVKNDKRTYIIDIETHTQNTVLAGVNKKAYYLANILKYFKTGTLRYSDVRIQDDLHNIIGKWLVK